MPSAGLAAAARRAPLACVERLLTRAVHLVLHRLETFCGAENAKTHHGGIEKKPRHCCWGLLENNWVMEGRRDLGRFGEIRNNLSQAKPLSTHRFDQKLV